MRARVLKVDDDGLHLKRGVDAALDVHFDGWRGWSVAVTRDQTSIRWPRRLLDRLDGVSHVSVTCDGEELFAQEVTFGSGAGRVELTDRLGNPVMIDKWGLVQRPFDGRREAGAVEAMAAMSERVLEVMREACGLEGWISFGTLLGAARDGRVIGHDSDIDLCYLSEKATPAEMAVELWELARALKDHGIRVKHRSGSFITVVYPAPDGGRDGIDIYVCFYVGDLLHETATVREKVDRNAVLPLRALEFEGRMMPAPADPDRMLTVSYGPNWRVPDPAFRHQPSREVTERFDAWFGLLMPQSREWGAYNSRVAETAPPASNFSRWVLQHVAAERDDTSPEDEMHIIDVGSGGSGDLAAYAAAGHRATGYDYAHPSKASLDQAGRSAEVRRRDLNLFSMRDAYSLGALVARQKSTQVVTARETLEALHPQAKPGFWQFASTALAAGGRAYLEGVGRSAAQCRAWEKETGAGHLWPLDPHDVAAAAQQSGGRVIHREGIAAASRAVSGGGAPSRWRMIVEWPTRKEKHPR